MARRAIYGQGDLLLSHLNRCQGEAPPRRTLAILVAM